MIVLPISYVKVQFFDTTSLLYEVELKKMEADAKMQAILNQNLK